jgi:pimeloyl-ACP methyl ester carboxylesterase
MALRIAIAGLASFACALLLSVTVPSGQANAQQDTKLNQAAHVYVFTGFGGAGRSYIDGVADKVRQRRMPTTVSSPGEVSSVAASAIERYKSGRLRSIVIVGYSLGGGAAMQMAAELGRANVPVQLVLTVDPVGVPEVSPNIRRLINYYVIPIGVSGPIPRPAHFRGILENIAEQDANPLGHFMIAFTRERELIDLVAAAAAPAAAATPAAKMTGTSAAKTTGTSAAKTTGTSAAKTTGTTAAKTSGTTAAKTTGTTRPER